MPRARHAPPHVLGVQTSAPPQSPIAHLPGKLQPVRAQTRPDQSSAERAVRDERRADENRAPAEADQLCAAMSRIDAPTAKLSLVHGSATQPLGCVGSVPLSVAYAGHSVLEH